ncbi:MAG: TRAP transporter small permease [Alkalilacustris sp.]
MARLLSLVDRALAGIETPLNLIGGVFILALAGLGIAQVVMRATVGAPIMGYIDIVEQGTAVFAFLGLAYTQRAGGHIRMELLLQFLPRPVLWPVEALNTLFAAVIVAILLPGTWQHFERAWRIGDSTMSIGLPTWPTRLLVALALGLLLVRLLVQLWGFVRLTFAPRAEPIGVPLPANAAEIAAEEVATARVEEDR